MKKICKGCKKEKFIYEFWSAPGTKDGKRGKCIECLKNENLERYKEKKEEWSEQRKEYYRKNAEYIKKKTKKWQQENKEKVKIYNKIYYKNLTNKQYENALKRKREFEKTQKGRESAKKYRQGQKWIARYTFRNAIRDGKIEKKDVCSFCMSKERVEGHHADYSKPLEITWVCRKCHSALHKALKERHDG